MGAFGQRVRFMSAEDLQTGIATIGKYCPICSAKFERSDPASFCPHDQTLLVPVVKDSLEGTQLDRYRIEKCIGTGGWSRVYKAEHIGLNNTIALKVLHGHYAGEPDKVLRFQNEAMAAARLQHTNIARVQDYGLLPNGQPYLAMDFVSGVTLAELIANQKLSTRECIELVVQICDGLEFAHNEGIVHRDLKPGNIMVTGYGADSCGTVKILDFGLAKLMQDDSSEESRLTKTGDVLGTPAYMSPEQCKGQGLDHRSDIYSVGCMLYEMLTGKQPFAGESALDCMVKHYTEDAPPLGKLNASSQVCRSLEGLVEKTLRKDPADRYQTAAELKQDLQSILDGRSRLAFRKRKGTARKRSLLVDFLISTSLAGVLAAGLVVCLWHPAPPAPPDDPHAIFAQKLVAAKQASEIDKAIDLVDKELARLQTQEGADSPQLAEWHAELGLLYATKQVDGQAITQLEQAISLRENSKGSNREVPERWISLLGQLYQRERRLDDVAKCLNKIAVLRSAQYGKSSLPYLDVMLELAENRYNAGKISEARSVAQELLTVIEKMSPPPPDQLAAARIVVAACYAREDKLAAAVTYAQKAVEFAKYAKIDLRHCLVLTNAAEIFARAGQYMKAEECYGESCSLLEQMSGSDSSVLADELLKWARVLSHLEKHKESIKVFEKALTIKEKTGDTLSPDSVAAVSEYAALLQHEHIKPSALLNRLSAHKSN